jgi:hypothetical protein
MISKTTTISYVLALLAFTNINVIHAAPEKMEARFFDGDGIERGNGHVYFDSAIPRQVQIARQPFESNKILDALGLTIDGREGGKVRYTNDDMAEPHYYWLGTPEKQAGSTDGQTEYPLQWQFGYNDNRSLTMNFSDDGLSGSWSQHTINLAGYLQTGSGAFTLTAVDFDSKLTPISEQAKGGAGSMGPLTIFIGIFTALAVIQIKNSKGASGNA